MHSDISHTTINMFFFKTYISFIWSEIAIRKDSFSTINNVDCSTLQTSHANQPTTYTYTNTHTNNCQSIHACMHSFNLTSPLHHSFTRTNEPRITIAIHHNHPSINHALHRPLSMAFVHARMTLPLLAHNRMHLHAYRLPITSQRYMHRDDNFLPPTECADEHLRWRWRRRWWWWWL